MYYGGDDLVTYDQLTEAASYLRHAIGDVPDIAFILGSGLGHMADVIENPVYVDYGDIPHFPVSTVAGHRGRFVYGCIHGKKVLIMQGRVHYYEGYDMSQVVMPVRVMGLLGVDKLLLTNAAGGISEKLEPGDIMMISDHISTFVPSPLICSYYNKLGVRFPDMTHVYDVELNSYIREAFAENDIDFRSGVYIQVTGPQYETPAEIRMFAGMGADAVGMSTVCEAIAARHMALEKYPDRNIAVINTCGAGGLPEQLTNIIYEGIHEGDSFDAIVSAADKAVRETQVMFALGSLDNLIKAGRLNKLVGYAAHRFNISAIGVASPGGRIELRHKFRGMKKTYDKLIDTLRETGFAGGELVISHCMNEEGAEKLGHLIKAEWLDTDVSVVPASGLCSYYMGKDGLIITYHE